jgi:ATP-binding cassette subfamily B (MDR/TAP) protein 1
MDATAAADSSGEGVRHGGGERGKDGRPEKDEAKKKVPLLGMFRYADRIDVLLMVVGTLGAMGNGVAEPLMSVLFGNVINSFGESTSSDVLRRVTKVRNGYSDHLT